MWYPWEWRLQCAWSHREDQLLVTYAFRAWRQWCLGVMMKWRFQVAWGSLEDRRLVDFALRSWKQYLLGWDPQSGTVSEID